MTMPEGSISIAHCGNSSKWFYACNNKQHYLKKENLILAKKLAYKKYLQLKIDLLEATLEDIKSTRANKLKALTRLDSFLADSEYLQLIEDFFPDKKAEQQLWMTSDYPKNTNYPEHLIHETVGGLKVRSKSESMIAIALYENAIPFRYENIITLQGQSFAPDFTILHPNSNRQMFWEHFGLMDNEDYFEDFAYKIKLYAREQIILGDNLIATFETMNTPLSFTTINNLINQYFKE